MANYVLYVNINGIMRDKVDELIKEEVKKVKSEFGPMAKVVGLGATYNELVQLTK